MLHTRWWPIFNMNRNIKLSGFNHGYRSTTYSDVKQPEQVFNLCTFHLLPFPALSLLRGSELHMADQDSICYLLQTGVLDKPPSNINTYCPKLRVILLFSPITKANSQKGKKKQILVNGQHSRIAFCIIPHSSSKQRL